MKRIVPFMICFCILALPAWAQIKPEIKFIADTLVVEAEGAFETDPDLATLKFDISSQDKELKRAYDNATQSMRRVVALAERSGLKKDEVSTGVLTLTPSYERDHRNKPKSYTVHGQIALKVRDFSLLGPLLDGAVEEGIVDFRSLTYSLRDEEEAKQKAVAEAVHHAVGRASAALAQNGQKAGSIRYASVDVTQLSGVVQLGAYMGLPTSATIVAAQLGHARSSEAAPLPPPPPVRPEKITVSAKVQCAFQIQ